MSNTTSILNDLIETLKDGQQGFREAAEDVQSHDLKTLFSEYSLQRSQFAGELQSLAHSLGVANGVHQLGRISVADLAGVYRRADVLLFPSFYEGFGWPPLEAMSAGLPVVSSRSGSLPEVSGEVPLFADPEDYDGLSAATCRFLEDEGLRRQRVRAGHEHDAAEVDAVLFDLPERDAAGRVGPGVWGRRPRRASRPGTRRAQPSLRWA